MTSHQTSSMEASDPIPSSEEVKVPSVASRRAACTHLTMERLYGNYRCNLCHRPSKLGWVYRCTQDYERRPIDAQGSNINPYDSHSSIQHVTTTNDPLPEQIKERKLGLGNGHGSSPISGNDKNVDVQHQDLECSVPAPLLNPWVEKAIREGHYTPEQVAILRAQKQKVVDTTKAAVARFQRESQKNGASNAPSEATTLPSMDRNPQLPFPTSLTDAPEPPLFPLCNYLVCQACRPTYRDRSWIRFEDVFARETPISAGELGSYLAGSPEVDVSRMRNISLHKPRSFSKAQDRLVECSGFYIQNGRIGFRDSPAKEFVSSTGVTDARVHSQFRDFRENMKRAIKSITIRENFRSGKKGKAICDHQLKFGWTLWKETNDRLLEINNRLLEEASSVALPGCDGMDGLEAPEEEADISNRVAVTEEAVETGSADVIMSI